MVSSTTGNLDLSQPDAKQGIYLMTEEENLDAKQEDQAVVDPNQAANAEVATQQEPEDKQERNFKAIREKLERSESEANEFKAKLAYLQAQMAGATGNSQPSSRPKKDKEDLATIEDLDEYISSLKHEIEEVKVKSRYPDAEEIIKKYGHEVNPILANAIRKSGDVAAAVEACKSTSSYIKDMMPKQESDDARRAIENANKVKSPSGTGSVASISKASKFASMTTAERRALQEQYIRGN